MKQRSFGFKTIVESPSLRNKTISAFELCRSHIAKSYEFALSNVILKKKTLKYEKIVFGQNKKLNICCTILFLFL